MPPRPSIQPFHSRARSRANGKRQIRLNHRSVTRREEAIGNQRPGNVSRGNSRKWSDHFRHLLGLLKRLSRTLNSRANGEGFDTFSATCSYFGVSLT